MKMLAQNTQIDGRSRWSEAERTLQDDARFKAVPDSSDREDLFNEFVEALTKKEKVRRQAGGAGRRRGRVVGLHGCFVGAESWCIERVWMIDGWIDGRMDVCVFPMWFGALLPSPCLVVGSIEVFFTPKSLVELLSVLRQEAPRHSCPNAAAARRGHPLFTISPLPARTGQREAFPYSSFHQHIAIPSETTARFTFTASRVRATSIRTRTAGPLCLGSGPRPLRSVSRQRTHV